MYSTCFTCCTHDCVVGVVVVNPRCRHLPCPSRSHLRSGYGRWGRLHLGWSHPGGLHGGLNSPDLLHTHATGGRWWGGVGQDWIRAARFLITSIWCSVWSCSVTPLPAPVAACPGFRHHLSECTADLTTCPCFPASFIRHTIYTHGCCTHTVAAALPLPAVLASTINPTLRTKYHLCRSAWWTDAAPVRQLPMQPCHNHACQRLSIKNEA